MNDIAMDTTQNTQTATTHLNDEQLSSQELEVMKVELQTLMEVAKVQVYAEQIEKEGTPEMKAKLKPFKEHYEGDVATLLTKRTKQNFDNDVWTEVSKKGEDEKAKYRQDPDNYLTPEEKDKYMQAAYDKTVEEAKKLAANLQHVVESNKPATPVEAAATPASTPAAEEQPAPAAPKRRLMFGAR